jgi:hypothetical protein
MITWKWFKRFMKAGWCSMFHHQWRKHPELISLQEVGYGEAPCPQCDIIWWYKTDGVVLDGGYK